MAVYKKGKIRARRPYKKKTVLRKSSSVSVAVKKYVRSTIHKNIENKCVQINGGGSFGNVFGSPDMDAYPLLPLVSYWNISQGVGQGARIGNSCKIVRAKLSYILRPNPYDVTTNSQCVPTHVQLFLGYVKQKPCELPLATDINKLFQSGSSVTAPVGTLRDIISVVNNDYWCIKKRWTHKIGYSANDGTGASVGAQYNQNNDFKLNVMKTIDITKFLPSHMRFDDTNSTNITKNLFFFYQALASNGTAYGVNALPTNMEFWLDLQYEDA